MGHIVRVRGAEGGRRVEGRTLSFILVRSLAVEHVAKVTVSCRRGVREEKVGERVLVGVVRGGRRAPGLIGRAAGRGSARRAARACPPKHVRRRRTHPPASAALGGGQTARRGPLRQTFRRAPRHDRAQETPRDRRRTARRAPPNILPDYEFELYEYDSQGNVIKVKYRGVWLISDNSYLNWSNTIPPFKETNSFGHLLFSEWVESMQKDIECAFGILKGRFRILKYGMRFHKVEHCDMLFKTLCALHNLLIKEDRLDTNWMGFEESLQEDQVSRNKFPSMLLRLHSL